MKQLVCSSLQSTVYINTFILWPEDGAYVMAKCSEVTRHRQKILLHCQYCKHFRSLRSTPLNFDSGSIPMTIMKL